MTHDRSKEFNCYLKLQRLLDRALACGVLLYGTELSVNQENPFPSIGFFEERLLGKPLHRIYVQCVEQNHNAADCFQKWERAFFLLLKTSHFSFVITILHVNIKGRLCNEFNETVQHLVSALSGWPALAQSAILKRYDGFAPFLIILFIMLAALTHGSIHGMTDQRVMKNDAF